MHLFRVRVRVRVRARARVRVRVRVRVVVRVRLRVGWVQGGAAVNYDGDDKGEGECVERVGFAFSVKVMV